MPWSNVLAKRASGASRANRRGSPLTSVVIGPTEILSIRLTPPTVLRNCVGGLTRSEEHTSELQSLMRISYAVFCLKKKIKSAHMKHTNDELNSKQPHNDMSCSI